MKLLSFARTERSIFSEWWWTVDRAMVAAALTLMGIGVVLVMAASPTVAERIGLDYIHFIVKHLVVLGPALLIVLGISFLSERQIWRLATLVLLGGLGAMVLVLFIGTEIKGAQRWLSLPGFSLQPSEFVKPAFAVFSAWLIARRAEQPGFQGLLLAGGVYGVVISLLLLQPDLGMSIVVTSIFAAQIFLAGVPFRYLIVFLLVAVMAGFAAYFSFAHVQSRIDRFLDPSSGDTYQIEKSIEAFENGGWLGTGAGQGTVKLTLPDGHADFIISVGAEEFGFFGIVSLISLFGFILWRGFQHLMNTPNLFVILAAGSLLVMFGLQTLIHMGSAMHLLPTKGMTLPFISYGGSSLLSTAFCYGIILALTRRAGRASISRTGVSSLGHENKLWA